MNRSEAAGANIMEWPVTVGDYVIGDINSSVAVVTLASDYRAWNLRNYAICGTCFTENFGIEKIIVNVLANPNINCLIVCGEESDHLAGQSLISLAENGVSTMAGSRKIIGSNSPLPYLNEIPMTAISRFLREIKVIDFVGNKDHCRHPESNRLLHRPCKKRSSYRFHARNR